MRFMKNSWFIFLPILFALLFSVFLVLANPNKVLGQMTIPTRTPVPDTPTDSPPQPTDDDGDNGGNKPSPSDTPQPENTPVPSPTPVPPTNTAVPPNTVQSPTPKNTAVTLTKTSPDSSLPTYPTATTVSGTQIDKIAPGTTPVAFPVVATSFPTAEPCSEPPTITTLTIANVYDGPGSDYLVSETLGAKEVRPIVGRAAYTTWWLIQIDGKLTQAWISDRVGTVQGFTGNVPIIEAPAINGALPTPGEQWDPTPEPICIPTLTPTSDAAVISGSLADGSSSSSEKAGTISDINVAADQRSQIAEAASPLTLDVPSATPTPNLLPIAGLVLVVAAIFVALFLRRNPGESDSSS